MKNVAWHFVRLVNGVPTLRDGRPVPPVGEWLEHVGKIEICASGLHASWRPIDALSFMCGSDLAACLVHVDGVGYEQEDKLVCRRRRVLAIVPCDDILRLFAREAALSVIHLWPNAPQVVREYLETGEEAIRAAARTAARAAAGAAAGAAAWAAARIAAWTAAGDAAWAAKFAELNALLESLLVADMDLGAILGDGE